MNYDTMEAGAEMDAYVGGIMGFQRVLIRNGVCRVKSGSRLRTLRTHGTC